MHLVTPVSPGTAIRANGNIQKDIEQVVGNYLYSEIHRRPMIFVNVSRN